MAGVLDALASYIQNMLLEMASQEMHMLLGVSTEIDNMHIKLRDLKNFLADADRRNISDQSVQAWVRELRDVMYAATDILDQCHLKAMERAPSNDAGCFNPLLFCIRNPLHAHDIGSRINNLNKRLDDIKARGASFNFINLGIYEDHRRKVVSSNVRTRETSGWLDESGLVGEHMEEDTKNLVDMLTNDYRCGKESKKIMVFSIVGVGGIGKTTLAQKIFNNEVIKHEFTKKIWLSVNQDYNDNEVLRRVITEAKEDHQVLGNAKVTLEQTLIQSLKGHKILLVMDDVWDYHIWEGVLQTPLVNAMLADGSRVLVTTRHDTIARQMGSEEPYHRINKLDHDDAWLLLKKQVVRDINDESQIEILKDVGMRLVETCDGLPLAIKVMGGLLCQKRIRRSDWQRVLDASLWSVSQMPKELNYAIYLSYEDLHPCLKPCFLHYSLLPKGKLFFVDDIVSMWISEGFIHGTSHELEEVGREYYDELIQRNLIEPDKNYARQIVCNMHDIVRSFAHNMLGDEALIVYNSKSGIDKLKSQKFIRLSVERKGSELLDLEWCSLQTQKSLRTLISVGNIKIQSRDSFVYFSSLRTLYLDSVNLDAIAESLCELKHLRFLSIENSNTSKLPEDIGKLKFLQYIGLYGCGRLSKLPSSIGMLHDLRYLRIEKTNIRAIPRDFSGLTSLRRLYGFPAHMESDHSSLEELGNLSQLKGLYVNLLENVASPSYARKAKLGEKHNLIFLSLGCTSRFGDDSLLVKEEEGISEKELRRIKEIYDVLCPPPCIEALHIRGYFGQRLPSWMEPTTPVTVFWSLRAIEMSDLACCSELPGGISQLPCLEHLVIIRAPAIKCVGVEFLQPTNHVTVAFSRLQELKLQGLVEWEEWVWEEQVRGMLLLEKFVLKMCKMRCMPTGLAFHARAMKDLIIHDVKNLMYLENFASVIHLELFNNTDLEGIMNLPKLQKLVICNCPKLKVLKGMPLVQRLILQDYSLQTLPGYLQDMNPRHFLLDCSLLLLMCIAVGKSGPQWHKFRHIHLVKAYADGEGSPRKWYMHYTRDPLHIETNISRSAIARARSGRMWLPYSQTCPIEYEWPVGRHTYVEKLVPLCVRFRCNAYRHLVPWLQGACLHCTEASNIASSSNQWTEAAVYSACRKITRTRRI